MLSVRGQADARVVRRVLEGEREDFAVLVERYMRVVHAVAYAQMGNPDDAEDVVQDGFLKAFEKLDTLRQAHKFGSWLISIVHNVCKERIATRIRQNALAERGPAASATAIPDIERRELHDVLRQQLERLDAVHREVLLMHYFVGKPVREIAALLDISPAAVKKRLQRARDVLSKQMLDEMQPDTETARRERGQTRRIMGIVAAAPVAWQPASTSGASSGTATVAATLGGLLAMKKAVVAIIVLIVGILSLWTVVVKEKPEHSEDAQPAASHYALSKVRVAAPTHVEEAPSQDAPATSPASRGEPDGLLESAATEPEDGVIAGRVYNLKTGEGIEGVTVGASPESEGSRTTSSGKTDESGRYRIAGLADGTYRVGLAWSPAIPRRPSSVMVGVFGHNTVEGVDFALDPGTWATVSGIVVDGNGDPVEGARIGARVSGADRTDHGTSDNDGRFEIQVLPASGQLHIMAVKAPFESEKVGPLALTPDGLDGLVLELTVPCTAIISGRVFDPRGRAVSGASIRLERGGAKDFLVGSGGAKSAEDGRFEIAGIAAGEYRINLTEPGRTMWGSHDEVMRVKLEEGQTLAGLRLVLGDKGGLSIAGWVVDTAGNPIAGALVECSGEYGSGAFGTRGTVVTNDDGTFRITGLVEGEYGVLTSHKGYTYTHAARTPADSENVEIVLEGCGNVEGRVRRADTDEPLTDFEVVGHPGDPVMVQDGLFAGNTYSWRDAVRFHDDEGRFRLTGINVGDVTVAAKAQGFAPALVYVRVSEHETVTGVELRLGTAQRLGGRVVDASGKPISGASICLGKFSELFRMGRQDFVAQSDAAGRFTIDGVSPHVTALGAYHPDYAPGIALITRDTVIVLQEAARVEGQVANAGDPLQGVTVMANYSPEARMTRGWARTERDGTFAIEGLTPMTVSVEARFGEKRRIEKRAFLEAGLTTRVDFDFAPASAVLEGRVTVNGQPPDLGRLSLYIATRGEGPEIHETNALADGSYRFEDLPAGAAALKVFTAIGKREWRRVRIPDIDIREGEVLERNIDLSGTGSIAGTITGLSPDLRGFVLALHGNVSFRDAVDSMAFGSYGPLTVKVAACQPDGSFEIRNLEPGTYTVVAETQPAYDCEVRDAFAATVVTVQNGVTAAVHFDLR